MQCIECKETKDDHADMTFTDDGVTCGSCTNKGIPPCPHCDNLLTEVHVYVKHRYTLSVHAPMTEGQKRCGYPLVGTACDPQADDEFNASALEAFSHENGKESWDAECRECGRDVTETIKNNMIAVY